MSLLGMTAWSPASFACASDPIMASVCMMAINPGTRFQTMNRSYMLADGRAMPISQNTALYSLLGNTFGGDGKTTFNLPDLRGRVVVGYDARDATRAVGANGGSASIRLTVAQLPPHAMTVVNMPVTLNNIQATTTLASLAATANLSGVVITGPASGLTVKVAAQANGQASPANNYLGKSTSGSSNIYANATPDATLNAGTIGGDLRLTVSPGTTAPVTITGAASTTVTGGGSASGMSASIGAGDAVPVMPPYLVLPYYIAFSGYYPSSD